MVKQTVILCENEIAEFEDLPEHIQQFNLSIQETEKDVVEEGKTLSDAVKNYEKRLILDALEKSSGVKTKAAKLLNIKRTTLLEKMKKQNLFKKAPA